MNKPADPSREKFVDRAEDLGGSIQLEFYKSVCEIVKGRHEERLTPKLATAMANYVFRFGLIVPDHAKDQQLMAALAAEKKSVCPRSATRSRQTLPAF
jgi:hypothetical protein